MKNTRDKKSDDQSNNNDETGSESGGFLGGIFGAVEGAREADDATRNAQQNRGIVGSVDDLIRGATETGEAARREADRQRSGPIGSINDIARGASDIARDAAASGGSSGGSGGGKIIGPTGRKWDATPEAGVTYDASGRRVDAGGQGSGSISDSLVGGIAAAVEGAQQAADTAQDDGEWRSISGGDDSETVGSAAYMERLRRGHEAAGTEFNSDIRSGNDPDKG